MGWGRTFWGTFSWLSTRVEHHPLLFWVMTPPFPPFPLPRYKQLRVPQDQEEEAPPGAGERRPRARLQQEEEAQAPSPSHPQHLRRHQLSPEELGRGGTDRGTDRGGQDSPWSMEDSAIHHWSGAGFWGVPPPLLVPPISSPPLPRCLYLFCDSFCIWGSCWGVTLRHWGVQPPPLISPPKISCAPQTHSSLSPWGGGLCTPWAGLGLGSGGCESSLLWGFGVSPSFWGCPPPCPGLALAGRAGSGGGAQKDKVGTPKTPKICPAVPAFSCWGVLGGWQGPHRGVTGGCMLHPSCLGLFGGVWGRGELL